MNTSVIYPGRFDEIRKKSVELSSTVTQHMKNVKNTTTNYNDADYYPDPRPLPKPINNALDGIDIIYWINLAKSTERRANMESIFQDPVFGDVKNIRFDAVNGYVGDNSIETRLRIKTPVLKRVEYACLLSHLETIRTFSESDYQVAMIMEDDITLEYKKYWAKTLRDVMNNAPYDWEILQLCYINDHTLPRKEYTTSQYASAAAYLIKNASAKRLIKEIYDSQSDQYSDIRFNQADWYLFSKMKTYAYKYPYFTYRTNNDSTLHSEDLPGHEMSKIRVTKMYQAMYPDNDAAIFQDISEGFGEKDLANGPSLQYYSYMYLGMSAAFLLFFQLSKMDIVKSWYKRLLRGKK
jgi:GR25 family glycosyltransferase involved in LPS biosynthesis